MELKSQCKDVCLSFKIQSNNEHMYWLYIFVTVTRLKGDLMKFVEAGTSHNHEEIDGVGALGRFSEFGDL